MMCSTIIRAIIHLILIVERFGFKICKDCDTFVNNSIENVMFECTAKDVIRQKYWMMVMEVYPVAMNRMSI